MTTFIIIVCTLINLTIITKAAGKAAVNKKAGTKAITHGAPVNKPAPRSWATRQILEEYKKVPESLRDEDIAGILEDLDRLHGVRKVDAHFKTDNYLPASWNHYESALTNDICQRDDSKNMCNPYWEVKVAVDELVKAGIEQEALLKEQSLEYTQVKSLTQRLNQNVTALTEANKELKGPVDNV